MTEHGWVQKSDVAPDEATKLLVLEQAAIEDAARIAGQLTDMYASMYSPTIRLAAMLAIVSDIEEDMSPEEVQVAKNLSGQVRDRVEEMMDDGSCCCL